MPSNISKPRERSFPVLINVHCHSAPTTTQNLLLILEVLFFVPPHVVQNQLRFRNHKGQFQVFQRIFLLNKRDKNDKMDTFEVLSKTFKFHIKYW